MNAKVHPLVVVLVIVLTLVAIGVWLWGTGEAKSIGGPAELKTDPEGHLYIQIQNQLLEHDATGAFLQRHDLTKLGVQQLLGGIGFFSNGDILLRRGPDPRTFSQDIRAYRRQTNDQTLEPTTPETGLYRCNLDTAECIRFGAAPIDFKAAHGIFIDWQTDEVYITDTTRHLLRKFTANGEPLAGPVGGFKFPNQLLLHDGHLYIANTNFHQIRKVDPRTDYFGEELEFFDVRPSVAVAAGQTWPSHVARVGSEWWVNNMQGSMSDGGIYVFDSEWRYKHRIALPQGADPISILPFHDEVLISDWNNDRVFRVSKDGTLLRDFNSPGLEQVLSESRAIRLQYQIYSYAGIALFLFVFIGLIIRTLAAKETTNSKGKLPLKNKAAPSDELIWLEPDPKVIRKITIALRLAVLLIIVVIVLTGLVVVISGNYRLGISLLLPLAGLAVICAIIAWAGRANVGTAISIQGRTVTLQDHRGRTSSCSVNDVVYDPTAIATPDMAIFLGQPHMSVYDRQSLNDELFPRLDDAQRISLWRMQKVLFDRRHPQGLSLALALLGGVAGVAVVLLQNVV